MMSVWRARVAHELMRKARSSTQDNRERHVLCCVISRNKSARARSSILVARAQCSRRACVTLTWANHIVPSNSTTGTTISLAHRSAPPARLQPTERKP